MVLVYMVFNNAPRFCISVRHNVAGGDGRNSNNRSVISVIVAEFSYTISTCVETIIILLLLSFRHPLGRCRSRRKSGWGWQISDGMNSVNIFTLVLCYENLLIFIAYMDFKLLWLDTKKFFTVYKNMLNQKQF